MKFCTISDEIDVWPAARSLVRPLHTRLIKLAGPCLVHQLCSTLEQRVWDRKFRPINGCKRNMGRHVQRDTPTPWCVWSIDHSLALSHLLSAITYVYVALNIRRAIWPQSFDSNYRMRYTFVTTNDGSGIY